MSKKTDEQMESRKDRARTFIDDHRILLAGDGEDNIEALAALFTLFATNEVILVLAGIQSRQEANDRPV